MIALSSTTIIEFPELGWGPFTLNKFLVEDLFGKLSIAWYGVIICCAMILACALILHLAVKKEGMNPDSFLDYFIFGIPLGVVGARAMYVLARLEEYDTFLEAVAVWNGGLAIYGGVIAGAVTIFVIAKIKKHPVLAVYDAVVPGLLLAQSIGRWGNFVNGEAYGETVSHAMPWGMIVNGHGPVHPTFLYESILTFTGFLLATFLVYRLKKVHGQVFAFYLLWYGAGRTLVEGLRIDSLMVGSTGLRLAQCIGIASALAGIALMVILSLYGKGIGETAKEGAETEKTAEEAPEAPLPEKTAEGTETEKAVEESPEEAPKKKTRRKTKKASEEIEKKPEGEENGDEN